MRDYSRREFLKRAGLAASAFGIIPVDACARGRSLTKMRGIDPPSGEDLRRLHAWALEINKPVVMVNWVAGWPAAKVATLAIGTPYEAFTLEQYLKNGGDSVQQEPLTLSLTRFDCVTLVESCLAVARAARNGDKPTWAEFAAEVERMRYRAGRRMGFASRLHYFSEWISDGAKRKLVRDMGEELGGVRDSRPLRFMTEHRASYPGLKNDSVFAAIGAMERSLDSSPRYFIPTAQIDSISSRIQTGDVLAFATSIGGLDVSHAAFAYREEGILRVLHAPLSGGSVEISKRALSDYVAAIKRSTGIMVARPIG